MLPGVPLTVVVSPFQRPTKAAGRVSAGEAPLGGVPEGDEEEEGEEGDAEADGDGEGDVEDPTV
jgi:hypothetical protein